MRGCAWSAEAPIGQIAALIEPAMNSRRLIRSPHRRSFATNHKRSLRRRRKWQLDAKSGTAVRPVLGRQLSLVGFNNGARNGQSQSHALRLCREKRLKDFLDFLGRNAR